MDEALKASHLEQITDPAARMLYDRLCAQVEHVHGELTDSALALVFDVALAEQIKQRLNKDINTRGAVEPWKNGRQRVMRENKSVVQVQRLMEQQRRNLAELGLTPGAKRKKEPAGDGDPEDDGDDFDKFE